ncbi:MAG: hypothetical protein R3A52_08155 [Polyangiales bacterium]
MFDEAAVAQPTTPRDDVARERSVEVVGEAPLDDDAAFDPEIDQETVVEVALFEARELAEPSQVQAEHAGVARGTNDAEASAPRRHDRLVDAVAVEVPERNAVHVEPPKGRVGGRVVLAAVGLHRPQARVIPDAVGEVDGAYALRLADGTAEGQREEEGQAHSKRPRCSVRAFSDRRGSTRGSAVHLRAVLPGIHQRDGAPSPSEKRLPRAP